MSDDTILSELLLDLAEELESVGYVGLHLFSWALRGQGRDLSEDDVARLARIGYERFCSQHEVMLVWVPWPGDLTTSTPAAPDTRVAFDLTEPTKRQPILALAARP